MAKNKDAFGNATPAGGRQESVRPAERTLFRGADVITLDQGLGELRETDVLVDGGHIVAIGNDLAVDDAEVIEGAGKILMPGLLDVHRHVWESFAMGKTPKISPKAQHYMDWKAQVKVFFSPEDAYFAEYMGGILSINSGITSLVDHCHIFPSLELAEQAARGLIASGIAGTFVYELQNMTSYGLGATIPRWNVEPNTLADDAEAWSVAGHLRERVFPGDDNLLRFGLADYFIGRSMTDVIKQFERIRAFEPHILATHFHIGRVPDAPGYFSRLGQLGEAGILGPDFQVIHANGITDEELRMLKSEGSMVASTTLGEQSYPYPSIHGRARQMGVAVGIGIDAPLDFSDDYFECIRSAFYNLFRTDEGRRIALSYQAEDVLHFATGQAVHAMRERKTGTIAVGQRADLVLLDTARLGFPAEGLLAERVVNYANQQDVDSVWIAGVARKRHGQMIGVDMAALKRKTEALFTRIQAQADTITFATPSQPLFH